MEAPPTVLPPDENRGYILVIVQVVMNSVAVFLVALRCYQMTIVKKIRGDDICIILGMVRKCAQFSANAQADGEQDLWTSDDVDQLG